MKIESLQISGIYTDTGTGNSEGVLHRKTLPCFSVVQALHGSYEIALGDDPLCSTGEKGVFVAPPDVPQTIVHHNGTGNYMELIFLFMNVTVNGYYPLESLFRFPTILPKKYNDTVADLLREIHFAGTLPQKYAGCYRILDILLENAIPVRQNDPEKLAIQNYVNLHLAEPIHAGELSRALYCSEAHIYRLTNRFFGMSPSNYVNHLRLLQAAKLLEQTELPVRQIAAETGFGDISYFSRLFKEKFGKSPRSYRNDLPNRLPFSENVIR